MVSVVLVVAVSDVLLAVDVPLLDVRVVVDVPRKGGIFQQKCLSNCKEEFYAWS